MAIFVASSASIARAIGGGDARRLQRQKFSPSSHAKPGNAGHPLEQNEASPLRQQLRNACSRRARASRPCCARTLSVSLQKVARPNPDTRVDARTLETSRDQNERSLRPGAAALMRGGPATGVFLLVQSTCFVPVSSPHASRVALRGPCGSLSLVYQDSARTVVAALTRGGGGSPSPDVGRRIAHPRPDTAPWRWSGAGAAASGRRLRTPAPSAGPTATPSRRSSRGRRRSAASSPPAS